MSSCNNCKPVNTIRLSNTNRKHNKKYPSNDSLIEIKQISFVGNNRTTVSFFQHELNAAKVIPTDKLAIPETNKLVILSPSQSITSIKAETDRLFPDNNCSTSTLKEMYSNLHHFTGSLLGHDLFEYVDTNLEINELNAEGKYEANVIVTLKEKGIPFLRTQSYVKTGSESDLGIELVGALRNPTGHGEIVKLGSIAHPFGSQEYLASLSVPHIAISDKLSGSLNCSLKKIEANREFVYSSFSQHLTSFLTEFTWNNDGQHALIGEVSLRDEVPVLSPELNASVDAKTNASQRHASGTVLNTATSSLKTSLKYMYTLIDTRPAGAAANPLKDAEYMQSALEVAMRPGNAHFVKSEVFSQLHRVIGQEDKTNSNNNMMLSLIGNIGMMVPLGLLGLGGKSAEKEMTSSTNPYVSYLSDRYHLGGPLSLRGFEISTVGAKSMQLHGPNNFRDSLGGDTKTTFLAMLSVPVPINFLAYAGMRAFCFFNAGSVGNPDYWKTQFYEKNTGIHRQSDSSSTTPVIENKHSYLPSELQTHHSPLFGYMRAAVGTGLSISFNNMIRLETTYSIPIMKAESDDIKAFQLGVGLSIN